MARSSALSLLVCVGCAAAPPISVIDAGPIVADPVPLRLVSWNMRQLGADGGSAIHSAAFLEGLSADVISVQEISTEAAFADLRQRLPAFDGALGELGPASGSLRQAIFWRSATLKAGPINSLMQDQPDIFPRPPLHARFELRGDAAPARGFETISIHFKASKTERDEQRRIEALTMLEQHMRVLSASDDEVLLMGDYNEALSDPRATDAFAPFTSSPERYRFLTAPLADAGVVTFLPARLLFDHLVMTRGLDGELDGGAPVVHRFDQQQADFQSKLSDHLPVMLDLTF